MMLSLLPSSSPAPKKPYLVWLMTNLLALLVVTGSLVFFGWGAEQVKQPVASFAHEAISLDYGNLFFYGMRTSFRMIIGLVISVIFSIFYASLAAKNKKAEEIMIPILDILQSVPILGYISFTVSGFVALAPSTVWGFEMAAIFAIFTSQAWNITFCIYQCLKKIPSELIEAAESYNFSKWRTFWMVEMSYTIPTVVWNSMISMSGGWFFLVAVESITYGNQKIELPGIGSYIALALDQQNTHAICAAVVVMAIIILIFDQLIFKSLISWASKFKYEMENSSFEKPHWLLSILRQSALISLIVSIFSLIGKFIINIRFPKFLNTTEVSAKDSKHFNIFWYGCLFLICLCLASYVLKFLNAQVSKKEVLNVFMLTCITFLRLVILLIFSSAVFVPMGIYIGLRPRIAAAVQPIAQFLSAFPANLLFPVAVICINKYKLSPDIWLSPLMIVAAQWYILFNVTAGAAQIPSELKDIVKTFKIRGWQKYKTVLLPAIMPYYLTGLITAAGGAWNASIVAEAVTWGDQTIYAHGVGAYITKMTVENNFQGIALGVIVMSCFVVAINKLFWRRVHNYVTLKFSYI